MPEVVGLRRGLAVGRRVRVALEPSGTYGDALRQALDDAGLEALRVSPKAAHDYAEIFDGTPSQHDGKDAAVVAGEDVPTPLLDQVRRFIDLNRGALLDYWEYRIDTEQLRSRRIASW